MDEKIDGTIPTEQKTEEKTAPDLSWQSAIDSSAHTVQDDAPTMNSEDMPVRDIPDSVPERDASVDFTLASGPDTSEPEQAAFADSTKDADTGWASLSDESAFSAEDKKDVAEPFAAGEDFLAMSSNAEAVVPGSGKKAKKEARPRTPPSGPFDGKNFGPVMASRPMMQEEDGSLVPTPPTITSRFFTFLALLPILLPVALFLVQVVFTLDTRALWYSDEVRYASAYRSMADAGDWLVLHLNGAIYPDKPPLFFWFLYGLGEAAKVILPLLPIQVPFTENTLFFIGVASSGLLCLLATHLLASFVARVDRRTVLAADLVLLSGFFFAALNHYLRMDLLFTACITLSHVFLFHAWIRSKAPFLMVLGYTLAGIAVLVKGPLGLAFPLLAGICFLLWQGRLIRFFKPDALFGLIIGLAVPGVWLALAWMNQGDIFLNNILHKQILARALDTWHHAEPWYHYLMTFPLIWLPWTLVLLFLPWGRFLGKNMRQGLAVSRTKDGAGLAYLWCAFLPGVVLLSLVSIKIPIYCLPLFPPLAILCARAILQMRPFAAACLQYSLAILLLVLGLVLVLMPAMPGNYLPLPLVPRGVMVLGGICLFFSCVLGFLIKPRRGEGSILVIALLTTAFAYPAWKVTAPSLDAFLSPKAQAEVLKEYREAGYFLATYKVYPGTYTYYAGTTQDSPSWEDAIAKAEANPKMVLALRASMWDDMTDKPEGFSEVHRQTIAERAYVLVARPPLQAEPQAEGAPMRTDPVDAPDAAPSPAPEAVEIAPPVQDMVSPQEGAVPPPAQEAMPSAPEPVPSTPEAVSDVPLEQEGEAIPDQTPSVPAQ